MATAYSAQAWTELFVASAGASAALTGLLFVAVSVNLERILQFPGLPERALQTLLLLLSAVLISLICLIPGQSTTALGIELVVVGVCFGAAITRTTIDTLPGAREHERAAFHIALLLPGTAPAVIGGISLLLGTGGGLYWIVAGVLGAIAAASVNAWVLLVEILR
ncbi:MAG TPA: hypothetical protein VMB51_05655 [Solirubrobacteraceae bacterium]|nr:hypothetical protein [Solirubrobacteraceae bacterium]